MKRHFIKRVLWRIVTMIKYRTMFNKIGKHTTIFHPLQLDDVTSISIGNNVCITDGAWFYGNRINDITLTIMDGTYIGHFAHIVAQHKVFIYNNVLIADRVFISDITHTYEDILTPILKQPIKNIGEVVIGEGTWIGENTCIIGAKIGKHCVIGANSVVTEDIPDYCVAVGSPAKVVKKYNFESNEWRRVGNT